MTPPNDSIVRYLAALEGQRFWGFLTLKFEEGRVVHLRREENLKPNELPGKNRGSSNGDRAQ